MLKICSKYATFLQLVKPLNFHHDFHHFLLYSSTSATKSSTDDTATSQNFTKYLVKSLGFTNQHALSISNRSTDFKLSPNSQNVVYFFKKHGFDDTQIRKIVSSYPKILNFSVDKTLIPKYKLFNELGISGDDLVRVISFNPRVLVQNLTPSLPELKIILGSDENLVKFFMKSSSYTTASCLSNLFSNVALLENDYDVCIDAIRNIILLKHGFLMRNPEFFRNAAIRVVEELRIPSNSGMFLNGIFLFCCFSEETIESKRQVLRDFGWSEYHVGELLRLSPIAFLPSAENIRKKMEFFMDELSLSPKFLVSHSAFFTYSLKKRILPRHRVLKVLKEKAKFEYNFYTAVIKSEAKFVDMLVEPFRGVVPGLLELYQNSKGCSVVVPRKKQS